MRQSDKDVVTVIGAGVTLHEALAAHDTLKSEGKAAFSDCAIKLYFVMQRTAYLTSFIKFVGKNICVIDPFTIKPLDAATILSCARATGGHIITVEDHYKEGRFLYSSFP